MNNIDQEVEQFKTNLEKTSNIVTELSNNNESIKKLLDETKDLNSIKDNLNQEIENIKGTVELLNSKVNELKTSNDELINKKVLPQFDKQNKELHKINDSVLNLFKYTEKIAKIFLYFGIGIVVLLITVLIVK